MTNLEPISKRLKRLRVARGLTILEMSRRAGVPLGTYRAWEYGRAIRGEPYLKLAEVLGISVERLMKGEVAAAAPKTREEIAGHLNQLLAQIEDLRQEILR